MLGALHAIDPDAVGLGDFGRPEGYLARQVARWRTQLDGSRSRELPTVDRLGDLLAGAVPETSSPALLHGDFRLDNVVFALDADDPHAAAVLDWEMATLGDALADLALFGFYWDLGQRAPELARALPSAVSASDGYPSFDELVDEYARVRGIATPQLDWYLALAAFKLAVIAEGIHYRFTLGKTVGAGFENMGAAVEPIAQLGIASLTKGGI